MIRPCTKAENAVEQEDNGYTECSWCSCDSNKMARRKKSVEEWRPYRSPIRTILKRLESGVEELEIRGRIDTI